jgi:Xaa-Pro aminopeptidase
MDQLDNAIIDSGVRAYAMYASSHDGNMRYLSGFWIGDPVVYIRRPGEYGQLIVPQMEYERTVKESSCAVMTLAEAGFFTLLEEEEDRETALARMIADQVDGNVLIPGGFPYALGQKLGAFCSVQVDKGTVNRMRAVKTVDELDMIRAAQSATEGAMELAISLLRKATPRDGELYLLEEPLTSDFVRRTMHIHLLERGYRAVETIVSCGAETALPHRLGEGILMEGEPIVIDIFPRDERTGYYSDMTRTVVRGEPNPEIEEMYNAVKDAQSLAEEMIRPGIGGNVVHEAVVEYFSEQGFKTDTQGFIHSLGHGVGLDVHEQPSLSPSGEELVPGNVVTVEPGLYYSGVGGVRLENIGAVTQQGFDCFTNYKREIRI